jgi:hypothetical protein
VVGRHSSAWTLTTSRTAERGLRGFTASPALSVSTPE